MASFTEKLILFFGADTEEFNKKIGGSLAQLEILRMSVQDMVAPVHELRDEMVALASEYESALANVNTLLSDSGEQIERYRKEIIELSKEVPQSATELAEGLYQVISAGVDAGDAMDFLSVASKSAVAGMSDTFTSVDALTTVLNSYNKSAKEAASVSDLMFQTVKLGKVTYGELASEIGMLAPVAAQAGVSLEEMFAAVATTSKKLRPEQTFVGLAGAITQLMTPGSEVDKMFQKLGYDSAAAAVKTLGLEGALFKLKESGANLFDLFDRQAARAVLALTASSEVAKKDMEAMRNATGASEEAFKKMAETDEQVTKLLQNNIDALKLSMTESFLPVITEGKKAVIGVLEQLNKAPKELKSFGGALIFAASAGGSLMEKTSGLMRNIAALREGFAAIKALKIGEQFSKATGKVSDMSSALRSAVSSSSSLKTALGAAGLAGAIAFTTTEIIKLVNAIGDWKEANKSLKETLAWAEEQSKKIWAGKDPVEVRIGLLAELRDLQEHYDEETVERLRERLKWAGIDADKLKDKAYLEKLIAQIEQERDEHYAKFAKEREEHEEKQQKQLENKKAVLEKLIAALKEYGIEFKKTGKIEKDIEKAREQLRKAQKKVEQDRLKWLTDMKKKNTEMERQQILKRLQGTAEYYEKKREFLKKDEEAAEEALRKSLMFRKASEEEQAEMLKTLRAQYALMMAQIDEEETKFLDEQKKKRLELLKQQQEEERKVLEAQLNFTVQIGETIGVAMVHAVAGNRDALKDAMKQILIMTLDYLEKKYILGKAATIIDAILTGGTSLAKDAPQLVAAHIAIEMAKAAIGSFAQGAIVQKSGLAVVHKDEAIMSVDRMADVLQRVMERRGGGEFPSTLRIVWTQEDGEKLFEHIVLPAQKSWERRYR